MKTSLFAPLPPALLLFGEYHQHGFITNLVIFYYWVLFVLVVFIAFIVGFKQVMNDKRPYRIKILVRASYWIALFLLIGFGHIATGVALLITGAVLWIAKENHKFDLKNGKRGDNNARPRN